MSIDVWENTSYTKASATHHSCHWLGLSSTGWSFHRGFRMWSGTFSMAVWQHKPNKRRGNKYISEWHTGQVTSVLEQDSAVPHLCHLHCYTFREVPLDVFKVHLCCAACYMRQLQSKRRHLKLLKCHNLLVRLNYNLTTIWTKWPSWLVGCFQLVWYSKTFNQTISYTICVEGLAGIF